MLFDTHAHVHFDSFKDDTDAVIKKSLAQGMMLNLVGTQQDTSRRAVEYAEKYEGVYASVGLHPEHLFSKWVDEAESSFQSREEDFDYGYYQRLALHPKVIGVGECGLDFYRIPDGLTKATMLPKQRTVFLQHIALAHELGLPLVIHCREAHPELLATLKLPEAHGIRGVIHCYTSDWQNARQYLDLGFYLGFTGIITFPPFKKNPAAQAELLEVVRQMPLGRLLLETDCPYLSPLPFRGKRCEPWMVAATAQTIAELRGMPEQAVVQATAENAKRLFSKIL